MSELGIASQRSTTRVQSRASANRKNLKPPRSLPHYVNRTIVLELNIPILICLGIWNSMHNARKLCAKLRESANKGWQLTTPDLALS